MEKVNKTDKKLSSNTVLNCTVRAADQSSCWYLIILWRVWEEDSKEISDPEGKSFQEFESGRRGCNHRPHTSVARTIGSFF